MRFSCVFAKIIVHQTALLPLLAFYPPSAYMLYICIYGEWQSELRKRWMVGGRLSAIGRNRSIIYGGKILLCLVSHVKAHISYFSLLLVLSSRSHMEISPEDQNPQSKGCFFGLLVDFVHSHRKGHGYISFMFNPSSALISNLFWFC